jgi:hypothetical protein
MEWMFPALLGGAFIVIVVGIARRNRRTNSDPAWHTDRYVEPQDTSGRTTSNFGPQG